MILFSHYGAKNDISGVTSWLRSLTSGLHASGESVGLFIQHFGRDPEEGNLLQDSREAGIATQAKPLPATTQAAVRQTLRHLNEQRPTVYLPQGLPATHFAAKIAQDHGLPWAFDTAEARSMFGGLAVALMLPEPRDFDLIVQESQRGLYDAVFAQSCHKKNKQPLLKRILQKLRGH